jgi:Ca-activated chloride channel homolog
MSKGILLKYSFLKKFVPVGGIEKAYVLFELHGKTLPLTSRSPLNLSIVLDRSGSMSGAPLQYCKEAGKFVINQLTEKDLLNVVVFDDGVKTVFPPQAVSHKDLLKQKIDQIHTGGMTNLSGGLIQGCQHILKQDVKQFVNRVILLSDGQANRGITHRGQLMNIVDEFNTAGAVITTMGVSEHFNEELMEGIADHGKGNYYFINHVEDIPSIFAKELDGLLSVVGQNLQFTITPRAAVKITDIYGYGFERNGHSLEMALGDMYTNEVKSILVECSLPANGTGFHDIFDIEWSFVDVTDGINDNTFKLNIPIEYTTDFNKLSTTADAHVEKQVEITESAKAIQQAMDYFDHGDYEKGKYVLYSKAKQMSEKAVLMKDAELMKESELLFNQLENFEYSKQKRKELHQQKYRQMKRRKED